MDPYRRVSSRTTPQTEPIPGKDMVENSAGGHVFQVDQWARLERFLILGSEGGTYYTTEQKLTKENATNVAACIAEDVVRVLGMVVAISREGRAPKNDPALFVLAMCSAAPHVEQVICGALQDVASTGTHLLHFVAYMEQFRGWGRAAKRNVARWFTDKTPENLGYQAIKYPQRDGWSLRDVLRLCHASAPTQQHAALFAYITHGDCSGNLPTQVMAAQGIDAANVCSRISEHRLPREVVPSELLNRVDVWDALLAEMPMTAMIRNLGKMTAVGLLKPMSEAASKVQHRLTDRDAIQAARVHPLQILTAMRTYASGHGFRGSLEWDPVPEVLQALDVAFEHSFQNVVSTGKNHLIGLDVSGSMGWSPCQGLANVTPREASAAMCLATLRSEELCYVMAFSSRFVNLPLHSGMSLTECIAQVGALQFGRTDCAQPMVYALANKIEVDAFIIYTDNETWCGNIHPCQALDAYRQKMGRPAKLIVNAMSATDFSIADPNDSGMMDVVGIDAAAPRVMADFIRG